MPSPQQSYNLSASTTLLLFAFLFVALFPDLFHTLWTLPFTIAGGIISRARLPRAKDDFIDSTGPMSWFQKQIVLPSRSRGSYLVTDQVLASLPELRNYKVGLLNLFMQHTSAALTLNENWDEDVRADMSDALDRIAPESDTLYRHDAEGADDMPAHIKSALIGASITIPIRDGKLATGTWQGIWYLEFRASKHQRRIMATIQGEKA
ncbi:UPF0047 protein [Escovopsis weberi]|uniref:UPF0047 protein n=1 Tax=Escovopsis weberi TaxID=150374 RepID=A0A0M8MY56_ESCWE|nr:UPF0047 protein [Escovopsis weberi]